MKQHKKISLDYKTRWLASKGYDLAGKNAQFIENLFQFYQPRTKPRVDQGVRWKQWTGTNRLHHYGSAG